MLQKDLIKFVDSMRHEHVWLLLGYFIANLLNTTMGWHVSSSTMGWVALGLFGIVTGHSYVTAAVVKRIGTGITSATASTPPTSTGK